jgi:hypothetical protein
MNNLQWMNLSRAFYDFFCEARQYGFYVEELEKMEKSIFEMNPYKHLSAGGNNEQK